jgi:hypothetical protein
MTALDDPGILEGSAAGDGVTVVYCVTITTGGGARGVGARAVDEDLGKAAADVDTPPISEPLEGEGLGF